MNRISKCKYILPLIKTIFFFFPDLNLGFIMKVLLNIYETIVEYCKAFHKSNNELKSAYN